MKGRQFVFALFAVSLACGTEPPRNVPADSGTSMPTPFLPVAVGYKWTYRVISASNVESTKVQTITESVVVDGETAYVFETARANDRGTRSIQRLIDNRLLRLSEESLQGGAVSARYRFSPIGLRIDGDQISTGDIYMDTHEKEELDAQGQVIATETKIHTFEVEADKELVTVPAGEFEAIRIRRDREGGSSKTYWFVPGLGKIKEIGGQTEELVSAALGQ
jgi:hypothetical protein